MSAAVSAQRRLLFSMQLRQSLEAQRMNLKCKPAIKNGEFTLMHNSGYPNPKNKQTKKPGYYKKQTVTVLMDTDWGRSRLSCTRRLIAKQKLELIAENNLAFPRKELKW